jgi:Protein of unknown function (DUF2726)
LDLVNGAENWVWWPGLFLAAIGVLFVLSRAGILSGRPAQAPYRMGRFLSPNEKCFLAALDAALGSGYRVFAQVRLADLVIVEEKYSEARRRAALNRVFAKSIDILICRSRSFEPVAAIEVDDRTHLLSARRERDALVDVVFREIGLPLLRVRAQRTYSAESIGAILAEAGIIEATLKPAFSPWR